MGEWKGKVVDFPEQSAREVMNPEARRGGSRSRPLLVALLTLLCIACLAAGFVLGRESVFYQLKGVFGSAGSPQAEALDRDIQELDAKIRATDAELEREMMDLGLSPSEMSGDE